MGNTGKPLETCAVFGCFLFVFYRESPAIAENGAGFGNLGGGMGGAKGNLRRGSVLTPRTNTC